MSNKQKAIELCDFEYLDKKLSEMIGYSKNITNVTELKETMLGYIEGLQTFSDRLKSLLSQEGDARKQYDNLSSKIAKLRDMNTIDDKDLAQAIHSPEYFIDLLISYQGQEGGMEVEQTIEYLNGTTHCLECGSTDDQAGEDYCEHCGQKFIWPKQIEQEA